MADHADLERLEPYGTARQVAVSEAVRRTGSAVAAGRELGMSRNLVNAHLSEMKKRAAARGVAPAHDMVKSVPEGYHVKGVSTLYDGDGNVRGQWVKSQKDREEQLRDLAEAIQSLPDPFQSARAPRVKAPKAPDQDLLCVYPMGDPHLGMYAWREETGQDFDLKIAEASLVSAVDHLVALAPPAAEALLLNMGDFFHRDNNQNRTLRSGHPLDGDSRWAKVLSVGIRTMRRCIDQMLLKHKRVTVVCEIGNHDDHSAIMLALCLAQYYEREPRVQIDTSPEKFHWYRFGACLIGCTHGDTVKGQQLPGIMAHDRKVDWGETDHRHWYCGHVHHDSVQEYPGVTVETLRTLAPRDAWAHAAGYRSDQEMKCDVWHRKWGRVNRHLVGIRQVWDREAK